METVLLLVVLATVVATFARRLSIPAPSLLVVAGVVVGLLPGVPEVRATPEMVSLVVLPPLIYAAGEEMPWRDLRAVWKPVTVLAIGLVLASAGVVGLVAAVVAPLPASMAFVLGAVLASTDPVAVSALGRRLSLPPRIQVLVQAESLFNDATSLVLFRLAVSAAIAGGAMSFESIGGEFLLLAGGGLIVGLVVAAGIWLIRRRTVDPVLETVIALVSPYSAYVIAETVGGSGVTAVVVCSVVLGAQTSKITTAHIRLQVDAVYGTVIFILESAVFALIGLQLPYLVRALAGSDPGWPWQALVITAALIAIRFLWVFPLGWIMRLRRGDRRLNWRTSTVVSWAGARGVVPLAAVLSIPLLTDDGQPVPQRDLVLALATTVIVITLVAQGFTLAPLVKRAGIARTPDEARKEQDIANMRLAEAGLAHLEQLYDLETAPHDVLDRLRQGLLARIDHGNATPEAPPGSSAAAAYRKLRRELLAVEMAELARLFEDGTIDDSTRRRLQRTLDLEDARLGDDP
ncbi:CPA1 family monovalent cation:H+ antiporter [Kutzneria kofuensis]|uniref:CPA1 family monovalent cation:H+ antiporter n=1 Tax=Kutzneria kofuensis TaxID=103725 RepID=A0A7W9NFT9_9PSEU|nr:CPA1 family monovalent cation:H+ antiporter [Kutzneria kofuensis]